MVTLPKYDATSSLLEHEISAFRRTKGAKTTIVFMLDGKQANVVFSELQTFHFYCAAD